MSNNQTQGASIEVERLIDAVRKLVKAKGRFHTEQNYKALADALDSYDAARRTPAAAAGAEELPPMPEASIVDGPHDYFHKDEVKRYARQCIAADRAHRDLDEGLLRLTIEQLKARLASADAHIEELERDQLKRAALQEIIDIGQEIEAVPLDESLCPACQGSGEGLMMEGAGPDAYEVPCNCPYCGGSGGLLDAYHGLVALLAAEHEKYMQACGQLFHANLAAPASAQPADTLLESHINHTANFLHGAQPDQRDSAAEIYTCIGKGGEYELIGEAWPAGVLSSTLMVSTYTIYRDTKAGRLFVRTAADFAQRMERLAADPSTAAQPVAPEIKDHNVRQLVNDLTAIGQTFGATQQLRSRISSAVTQFISAQYNWKVAAERRQGQDSANNSAEGEKNAN